MATNNAVTYTIIAAVVGFGIYTWSASQDDTPIGLVVTKTFMQSQPIGQDSDDNNLTANVIEGTWRADADSISVASESADNPLMVVYQDGKPIYAEVITLSEFEEPDGRDYEDTEEGRAERLEDYNASLEKWRVFAKAAGATEESIESQFPMEVASSPTKQAEAIFGPMVTLQSNFVW